MGEKQPSEVREDLSHRFRWHPPNSDRTAKAHGTIRRVLDQAAHHVDAVVPGGREKALALTKLEEAMMWANAGIARAGGPAPGWEPPIEHRLAAD